MLTRMKQELLQSENLSWLCIEPMLLTVRGKSPGAKREMFNQLNEGQQALYLFYAFHNHANTMAEFYWFTTYFIADLKAWTGLKTGVLFFQGYELIKVLEQMESVIHLKNKLADGSWKEASPADLERDTELNESIQPIFKEYQINARKFIESTNKYIKDNKHEFLEIEII
ncbi:hypothetical protein QYF50_20735 [Paenibacillus vini]|uniref:hypothetical protein n=1 Tax=Paenibacillus vini TaxID=1476024 RepID=UPI0025B6CBB0|nr:hypothetical protein [Paenibacillus vini]MDN4070328.1 hypothetical protein [Paenibacillus vini]